MMAGVLVFMLQTMPSPCEMETPTPAPHIPQENLPLA